MKEETYPLLPTERIIVAEPVLADLSAKADAVERGVSPADIALAAISLAILFNRLAVFVDPAP